MDEKLGAGHKVDANRLAPVDGNVFYKVRAPLDGDSAYLASISNNVFFETEMRPISNHSRHFPIRVKDNVIYNCNTNPPDSTDYQYSTIQLIANEGFLVKDNIIVDDRALRDATTAPSLTQTHGGPIGTRTYYVKYTWANDTGKTLASSEAIVSMSANKLLTVTPPTTLGVGAPSEAKYIEIFVGTTSGETLQTTINIPNKDSYTEAGDDILTTNPLTPLYSRRTALCSDGAPGLDNTSCLGVYGISTYGGVSATYGACAYGSATYASRAKTAPHCLGGNELFDNNNHSVSAVESTDLYVKFMLTRVDLTSLQGHIIREQKLERAYILRLDQTCYTIYCVFPQSHISTCRRRRHPPRQLTARITNPTIGPVVYGHTSTEGSTSAQDHQNWTRVRGQV